MSVVALADRRAALLAAFAAGVDAVGGERVTAAWLAAHPPSAPVAVIALGKAAGAMARGAQQALGERLATEPELQRKVDDWVERALAYVVDHYRSEVTDLIATTVARWDGERWHEWNHDDGIGSGFEQGPEKSFGPFPFGDVQCGGIQDARLRLRRRRPRQPAVRAIAAAIAIFEL